MGRRFGSGAAILAVGLWASVGAAQTTANPGGEIDVIAWSYATISQSGAVVAMETISGARGGGATFDLGPGHWIITTECHGGGACAPHALTGLRLNGRQIDLPGPTEELELRFDEAGGVRRVWLPPGTHSIWLGARGVGKTQRVSLKKGGYAVVNLTVLH